MEAMNQSQFAKHIGKKPGYVTLLKQMGRLVLDDNGRVLVEASLEKMAQTADPSKQGVVERHERERTEKQVEPEARQKSPGLETTEGKAGSAYQQARAMKEKYNAMQAKIAYEREIGELLPIDEVRAAVMNSDAIIRNRLESLPDILAPQIASETDEQKIRTLLIDQIEQMLNELSKSLKRLEADHVR